MIKYTKEQIENLKKHKYQSCEYTKLDNLMNKFWYFVIDYTPTTLAPNTITLLGLISLILAVGSLMITSYDTDYDYNSF